MKIRITGNSVRFRLTKTEVGTLCNEGSYQEITDFCENSFKYAVKATRKHEHLRASYKDHTIILHIPYILLENWHLNDTVGFYHNQTLNSGESLSIILEKDFVCMDETVEDQSDNYPNPKAY